MAQLLNMPKLGMDMEEGTILHWFKKTGDQVKKGEEIAEIETDKASMTLESPDDGVILCLYCQEDESVPVNRPIAAIGQPGEQPPQGGGAEASVPPATESPECLEACEGKVPVASTLNMPKLGMDMEEGTILHWMKKEGDQVKKGEVIAEIETDKASMEVEAPVDGVVLHLYHKEDESVPVNQPIAAIGQPGDQVPQTDAKSLEQPEERAEKEQKPQIPQHQAPAPVHTDKKPRVSPRARRLAQKCGVDLRNISGTGPSGRIVEQDVRSYMEHGMPCAQCPAVRTRSETVLPLTKIRKITAVRMQKSLSEMAQANHRMDVDMTNMVALRKQLNGSPLFSNAKVSFVDLLVLACSKALIDCPFANVCLEADGIHQKNYTNIGVAVDTPRGLVVPVIHDADVMNIQQIAQANRELIDKARAGTLTPDEMSGGTFTITNLGMFGIDSFTAIINPPEACILAVGRIVEKVVAENGAPVIRPIMNLSLTYDHRILDGAPAARLLQRIQYYIENPALLLLQTN